MRDGERPKTRCPPSWLLVTFPRLTYLLVHAHGEVILRRSFGTDFVNRHYLNRTTRRHPHVSAIDAAASRPKINMSGTILAVKPATHRRRHISHGEAGWLR